MNFPSTTGQKSIDTGWNGASTRLHSAYKEKNAAHAPAKKGTQKSMLLSEPKTTAAAFLIAGALVGSAAGLIYQPQVAGQTQPVSPEALQSPSIPPEQFARLHKLIKPGLGELRFHEIPWLLDVTEARRKAAALGKPILVWSGAGGAPIGIC
jgi:hypothetical protein